MTPNHRKDDVSIEHLEGLALGHAAAEEAHEHATEHWRSTVHEAFEAVIREKELFSSNDVYAKLGGELPPGADPRAIGAVFRRYASLGSIVGTDQYEPSRRRSVHGRAVRVWRSRVVDG